MTSSQPVVTPNAINFTPDNKHAYVYSGAIEVANTAITLAEFTTQSETLIGKAQFFYVENANDRFAYTVKFNDEIVAQYYVFGPADTNGEHLLSNPVILIIPPFTNVKLLAQNIENTNSRQQCTSFTGKAYGMIKTDYQ